MLMFILKQQTSCIDIILLLLVQVKVSLLANFRNLRQIELQLKLSSQIHINRGLIYHKPW